VAQTYLQVQITDVCYHVGASPGSMMLPSFFKFDIYVGHLFMFPDQDEAACTTAVECSRSESKPTGEDCCMRKTLHLTFVYREERWVVALYLQVAWTSMVSWA
jgi:hypothetical protein